MKYLALLLVVFLSSNTLFGQSLTDSTKLWSTVIQGPPYHPVPTIYTETIIIGQDTVIDLISYKKVLRSTDEYSTNWDVYCFIRETLDEEIYVRSDTALQEYLLYDFGAEKGDTVNVVSIESHMTNWSFAPGTLIVDSIDSIFFADQYRKRINLNGEQWIEGIGSLTGILHNKLGLVGGDLFELICFSESEVLKYQNPAYSSCYYSSTGLRDIAKSEQIIVFPNPISDKSTLRIIDGNYKRNLIEIYDSKGVKVKSKTIEEEFIINRADYNTGVYLYQVLNNGKLIGAGKLIME
jgi:hypothetical protein